LTHHRLRARGAWHLGPVARAVSEQHVDGLRVLRNAANPVGLGVLLDASPANPDVVSANIKNASVQIDVVPPQSERFRSAHAGLRRGDTNGLT
jgi:hypothetical protein